MIVYRVKLLKCKFWVQIIPFIITFNWMLVQPMDGFNFFLNINNQIIILFFLYKLHFHHKTLSLWHNKFKNPWINYNCMN